MNKEQPLVSFVISVYNQENFIIKSLNSILAQTYKNIEIRVIDDCSTDSTYSKLLEFEKKYKNVFLYKADIKNNIAYNPIGHQRPLVSLLSHELTHVLIESEWSLSRVPWLIENSNRSKMGLLWKEEGYAELFLVIQVTLLKRV